MLFEVCGEIRAGLKHNWLCIVLLRRKVSVRIRGGQRGFHMKTFLQCAAIVLTGAAIGFLICFAWFLFVEFAIKAILGG